MTKTFKKSKDGLKLEVDEEITKTHQQQYTESEIDDVLADLQERLTKFQELKAKCQELSVGTVEPQA